MSGRPHDDLDAAPDPGPSTPSPEADVPAPRGDRPEQDDEERGLQQENAETSLDQPSQ